jgi:hypothetical protein
MERKLIFALIILLFCFVTYNCSAQSLNNTLVGKWELITEVYPKGTLCVYEFFKDGSGIISIYYGALIMNKDEFIWKIADNGNLTLIEFEEEIICVYKISGSILTFEIDGEEWLKLKRKL